MINKQKLTIFFFLLWFLIGLLLGYYFGSTSSTNQQPTDNAICNSLTTITPASNTKITSPLTVSITVDNTKSCKWTVFEGQAGVAILQDGKGRKIGSANLTTKDNWMTEKPVVYTGTIEFVQKPASSDLLLVITEEKISGLGPEENGQSVTIPLTY